MDAPAAMAQTNETKLREANEKFLDGASLTNEELSILTTYYSHLANETEGILGPEFSLMIMELRRRKENLLGRIKKTRARDPQQQR